MQHELLLIHHSTYHENYNYKIWKLLRKSPQHLEVPVQSTGNLSRCGLYVPDSYIAGSSWKPYQLFGCERNLLLLWRNAYNSNPFQKFWRVGNIVFMYSVVSFCKHYSCMQSIVVIYCLIVVSTSCVCILNGLMFTMHSVAVLTCLDAVH